MKIQPVILAGGIGSRLWPLSWELHPKQLLQLVGDHSLLQGTLARVLELDNITPPILVVGEEHRFIAKAQIAAMNHADLPIILEPVGRNTAPAIYAAACYCRNLHPESVLMLVLPTDHLIKNTARFAAAVRDAAVMASHGKLVTFGIKPTAPETGYGYIKQGDKHRVLSFVEKPDLATARGYLADGNYLWNSGMFAFTNETLICQMDKYCPKISDKMRQAVDNGAADGSFFRLQAEAMLASPSVSIDYALMEKSDQVTVVPASADMGWDDIGSLKALWDVSAKDTAGNVVHGDAILEDVKNSFVYAQDTLVAAVGLEDTIIVETDDAVLVAPMARAQDVRKVVRRLRQDDRQEYKFHCTVYRPWGSYTVLEEQPEFKIKRLTVLPQAKLSLQMHHHRSEHLVVVKGTARVTCGDKEYLVTENQSSYIPCGERHRLENPGVIPLELIEVQNGSYLGEDDIVRFDNDFGGQD
ncbi:MAG: mannose-1-phosphate guanylyltransferase/mannose-6-phosphate isomerase [Deltaproteobacteria bacterium]|nr:mannose-1-phosphate guanylyltransferase/mannose-6-phosphate isomerase [Deltaproteobacteria bacterium]